MATKAERVKEPNAIARYFRETRAELGKVSWPTRQEAVNLTVAVVVVVTIMAIFLGSMDFLFSRLFAAVLAL